MRTEAWPWASCRRLSIAVVESHRVTWGAFARHWQQRWSRRSSKRRYWQPSTPRARSARRILMPANLRDCRDLIGCQCVGKPSRGRIKSRNSARQGTLMLRLSWRANEIVQGLSDCFETRLQVEFIFKLIDLKQRLKELLNRHLSPPILRDLCGSMPSYYATSQEHVQTEYKPPQLKTPSISKAHADSLPHPAARGRYRPAFPASHV
jgi:hypothetical protein